MFVIDANKKNSWHWFDSVSWVYDFPMWWEYYTIFDTEKNEWRNLCWWGNYYANKDNLNIACPYWNRAFFSNWTWKDDEYTEIAWAKVRTVDWDITYPYHALWNNCFQPSNCKYYWCSYTSFQWPILCFTCMDICGCHFAPQWYNISNSIIYNIASRKKFKWWELVWRTIDWDTLYAYQNAWFSCSNYWDISYLGAPISIKMTLWLLHTDGTISDILSKTITTRCYSSSIPSGSGSYYEYCVWRFLEWQQSTDWLIACAWDRLIYDIRFPEWAIYCPRQKYRNSSTCTTAAYLSWSTFLFCTYQVPKRFNKVYFTNYKTYDPNTNFTNSSCYSCFFSSNCLSACAYSQLYTMDAWIRFNWITVSVE